MNLDITQVELRIARAGLERLTADPFLFGVVTGTHQYGFISPDGDIDVRGAFVVPTRTMLGLQPRTDHFDFMGRIEGREVDALCFEIGRYLRLIIKGSGNHLEELFSPIVIHDAGYLAELRSAVSKCLTRSIARHYIGFFESCVKKLRKKEAPEVKTALYGVRIALTGITLLREGTVQAHLPTLCRAFGLDFVEEWIALKTMEHDPIPEDKLPQILERLVPFRRDLRRAAHESVLPKDPQGLDHLNDLLVRIRLAQLER